MRNPSRRDVIGRKIKAAAGCLGWSEHASFGVEEKCLSIEPRRANI